MTLEALKKKLSGGSRFCCFRTSDKLENAAITKNRVRSRTDAVKEIVTKNPCNQVINAGNSSEPNTDQPSDDEQHAKPSPPLLQFSYDNLRKATSNFKPNSFLGEGGFGSVFKGWIDEKGTTPAPRGTGRAVAVKVLNQCGLQGHKEWLAEINLLGQLRHPHIVKLIGFCMEQDHRLLVYEFMQRGNVENHLFRPGAPPLPWDVRIKIAMDVARGLEFLHSKGKSKKPVIYRDLKAANVLLDKDSTAKLADFGYARNGPEGDQSHISTKAVGTAGYAAPEYVILGHLTVMCDVYSFGVLLLELMTGKRSIDKQRPAHQHSLVQWCKASLCVPEKLVLIVDERLSGQFPIKGSLMVGQLAERCLRGDYKTRPLMNEVIEALVQIQSSGGEGIYETRLQMVTRHREP